MTSAVILKIIKSKYFWAFLILLIVSIYVAVLNINIKTKELKIKDLNNEIMTLEAANTLLYKDLSFKSNQIIIKEIYTGSDKAIETLEIRKLNSDEIEVLNNIIRDYNTASE